MLEKAPKEHRGGNSALTVHMLFAYDGVEDVKPLVGDLPPDVMRQMEERVTRYTKDMYYDNIMRVTEGKSEPELATILVERSTDTVQWMRGLGHLWAPTFDNPVSANVVSWEGGGHGMSTRWFDAFERVGGTVLYDTQAVDLLQDDQGRVIGVRALGLSGFMNIYAGAVIMAAGSFESNAEMRARYLGPLWDTIKLRGTPFNTGEGLQMAMNIGALPNGSWSSCHASPQDAERPAFDYPGYNKTGDFWSRYSYPFSVMVNVYGKRFVDEGETWRGLTYAKMGRAILAQPRGAAFQVFDQKHRQLDVIRGYEKATGFSANTLEELAGKLGILDIPTFMQTVRDYNDATQPGEFGAFRLDGLGTPGLEPPRSNWALPLDTPPYEGFPVVCGMTFCFGGLKTSTNCEVTHTMDRPIPGLYAVGEMLGGLWHWNYPSGGGMMAGAVYGRIAGTHAATSVVG